MSPTRKPIAPGPNEKCLCGSDLKYKKCCVTRLPGSKDIGVTYRVLANAGDAEAALLAARADISQYTIWHRSHTVRGLFDGSPAYRERIWHIDVEALCDYAERLIRAYRRAGRGAELPAVIERLRQNIQTEAWHHKIIFLQCLCALGEDWNVERGLREITKLGPVDQVRDPALLAMYVNLLGDSLSLSKRLVLIDQVIEMTEDDSTRIHQGVVKATLLWIHNDTRGAVDTIGEVVELCERLDGPDEYQQTKFGQSLFIQGSLRFDHGVDGAEDCIRRAIKQFHALLDKGGWSGAGRAELHRDIGEAHRVLNEWDDALVQFELAIEADDRPILQVFRAECLNGLRRYDEAQKVIDGILFDSFADDAEKADYVIKFAALAVEIGDKNRLERARSLLDLKLKREPIFFQHALRMKTIVLEAIEKGKSPSLTKRAKLVLSAFNSLVMLQPNIMGIGFNFNKLIDRYIDDKAAIRAHTINSEPDD